jgi:hypothetical protein
VRIRNACGPLSRTRDDCPWGLPTVPFALRRVGPLAESGKASQGIQAMTDGGAALEVIRSAERQVLGLRTSVHVFWAELERPGKGARGCPQRQLQERERPQVRSVRRARRESQWGPKRELRLLASVAARDAWLLLSTSGPFIE